jgi:hypothetical protein
LENKYFHMDYMSYKVSQELVEKLLQYSI